MKKVYIVTVFESGDFTTSVWAVYSKLELAEKYKAELEESELNRDGYYVEATITEHEVREEFE